MALELSCRRCGAAIPADHVHVELALARCASCRTVLDLTSRVAALEPTVSASQEPRARPLAPLPERFQVEAAPHQLRVQWRWFGARHLFMLLFCLVWDGFLVAWYGLALSGGFTLGPSQAPMLLFPVVHVAVGVGITYATLSGLLNRTVLTVEGRQLTIRHGPLPARGNLTLHAGELAQLYCEEHPITSRGQRSGTRYSLNAVDRDGRRRVLLRSLEEAAQVLWLEQELERRLDLRDAPVAGELRRARGAG